MVFRPLDVASGNLVKLRILFSFIVILSQLPIFRKETSSGPSTSVIFVIFQTIFLKMPKQNVLSTEFSVCKCWCLLVRSGTERREVATKTCVVPGTGRWTVRHPVSGAQWARVWTVVQPPWRNSAANTFQPRLGPGDRRLELPVENSVAKERKLSLLVLLFHNRDSLSSIHLKSSTTPFSSNNPNLI